MIYLGIHAGHNSSASLMRDGKIIFALQEERFTNIKNCSGYPKQSIAHCLEYIKSKKLIIDVAAFATIKQILFHSKFRVNNFFDSSDYHKYYSTYFNKKKLISFIENHNKYKKNKGLYLRYDKVDKKNYFNPNFFRNMLKQELIKQSKKKINKIVFLDHHTCHAYYSYYSAKSRLNNSCVISVDSYGDGANQTIWMTKKNC